jgi:hypothetical protein
MQGGLNLRFHPFALRSPLQAGVSKGTVLLVCLSFVGRGSGEWGWGETDMGAMASQAAPWRKGVAMGVPRPGMATLTTLRAECEAMAPGFFPGPGGPPLQGTAPSFVTHR